MTPISVALIAFVLQQALLAGLWLTVRTRMAREDATYWALGALAVAGGVSLIATRSIWSPWIGVWLANVLIFAAVGLIACGIAHFVRRPFALRWALLAIAAQGVVLAWLLGAQRMQGLWTWVALSCTVVAVWSALTVQGRLKHEFGAATARLAAAPLWVVGLLFVVRTLGLLVTDSPMAHPLDSNHSANVLMVLAMMAAGLITNMTLLALVTLRLTRRLEHAGHHDPLTGLMNRRRIGERLAEEFARQARYPQTHGLLAIDIDHFKQINDSHGHPVGDEVLKAVAQALREASRESDSVARVGGEEFWVLMPHVTPDGAALAAQRMVDAVRALQLDALGSGLAVTVSVGVAVAAPQGDSTEALLHRADAALYQAKADGRNRVAAAPPAQAPSSSAPMSAASLSSPPP